MAGVLRDQCKLDEALSLLERALPIFETTEGPLSVKAAHTRFAIASILHRLKHHSRASTALDAEAMCAMAVYALQAHLPPSHPLLLDAQRLHAALRRARDPILPSRDGVIPAFW